MMQPDQGPTGSGGDIRREGDEIAQHVRGTASDVANEAREAARSVRDEAVGLAAAAKEQLSSQAEASKHQVADRISSVADRLHRSADDLRGDEAWLANLLDEGVQQLAGLADTIKQRDMRGLFDSLQDFGRRQPALFAGAAVAVGFATARLAKASADRSAGHASSDYGRSETAFPSGAYGSTTGSMSSGQHQAASTSERTGHYGISPGGTREQAERELSTEGHYSGAQAPHSLHEDRSADLPMGDSTSGASSTPTSRTPGATP